MFSDKTKVNSQYRLKQECFMKYISLLMLMFFFVSHTHAAPSEAYINKTKKAYCHLSFEQAKKKSNEQKGGIQHLSDKFESFHMLRYMPKKPKSSVQLQKVINKRCSVDKIRESLRQFDYGGYSKNIPVCIATSKELQKEYTSGEDGIIRVQKLVKPCKKYFSNTFFKNTFDMLKAKELKASIAKKKKRIAEEKKLKEKKAKQEKERLDRLEQERLDKEKKESILKKRQDAFFQTGIPQEQWVIWGGDKHGQRNRSTINNVFEIINYEFHKKITISNSKKVFTPPKKGEFEKTIDYQARVAKLKDKHGQLLARQLEILKAKSTETLMQVVNEQLGEAILSDLQYNADEEVFNFVVKSTVGYTIQGKIKAPLKKAKATKASLLKAKPWILYQYNNRQLSPALMALQNELDIYSVEIKSVHRAFEISSSKAQIHEKKLKIAEKERSDIKEKLRVFNEKQRAAERALWPSNAVAKIRSGATMCSTYVSIIKARAIANNSYLSIPSDCFVLSNDLYARNTSYLSDGIVKVLLVTGIVPGYILPQYIEK